METEKKSPKTIQSVQRALDILEFITEGGDGYPLSKIADACGLNKTTTFHLLKTLESRGYVEQSFDTQFYKDGWKLYALSSSAFNNQNIVQAGRPFLMRLFQEFNETALLCYCGSVNGRYMSMCFCQLESTNPLHTTMSVGTFAPLHCTAAGKTYLIGLSKEMLDLELNQELTAYTPHTITDPDLLRADIEKIRQQGYCIEREEYQEGVCTVAVPVFKYTGRTIFSLVLSMPVQRAADERLNLMLERMIPMAKELSKMPF